MTKQRQGGVILQLPEGREGVGVSQTPKFFWATVYLCMNGNRGPSCLELWLLLGPREG